MDISKLHKIRRSTDSEALETDVPVMPGALERKDGCFMCLWYFIALLDVRVCLWAQYSFPSRLGILFRLLYFFCLQLKKKRKRRRRLTYSRWSSSFYTHAATRATQLLLSDVWPRGQLHQLMLFAFLPFTVRCRLRISLKVIDKLELAGPFLCASSSLKHVRNNFDIHGRMLHQSTLLALCVRAGIISIGAAVQKALLTDEPFFLTDFLGHSESESKTSANYDKGCVI